MSNEQRSSLSPYPPRDGMLVRIQAPHFVAGIIIHRGRVIYCAPILRWMINMSDDAVRSLAERKGWRATIVRETATEPLDLI